MKTLMMTLLAFVFAGSLHANNCINCNPCVDCGTQQMAEIEALVFDNEKEENSLSVMTLTVESVKGSVKAAKKLEKQLLKVDGVREVSVCQNSGTVKISYDKPEMGCCSRLHSALQDKGWKYEMVSNQETPACAKKKSSCPGHGSKSES